MDKENVSDYIIETLALVGKRKEIVKIQIL